MFRQVYKLHFKEIEKNTIYHYVRAMVVISFKRVIPLYFKLTSRLKKNKIVPVEGKDLFIVSLTTFPNRIDKVWLTIESILRQDVKPDKILLWLYKGEFKSKETLPKNLLKLQERGLEIRFCDENLMPHKKYYYTMKMHENANIITIDDDIIYPPDLIKKLIFSYRRFPKAVSSIVNRVISKNNTGLNPYKKWKHIKKNTEPRIDLLPIGMGGVLYPAGCLNIEVYNKKILKEKALKVDDIWLKMMGLLNKTGVAALSGEYTRPFFEIEHKQNVKLADNNLHQFNNDTAINNILKYYEIPFTMFDNNI